MKPIKREIDKISRESQSYIDKLSKETDKAINTPHAGRPAARCPSPAPAASQADPTDRQDDGRVSDPYGLNTAAPEPAGETAETKEAQETGQGEGASGRRRRRP